MADDLYAVLEPQFEELSNRGEPPPAQGNLGYDLGDGYAVVDPNDPSKYYVYFASDGTWASVYHKGRCAPSPDLPVLVRGQGRDMFIEGTDHARMGEYAGPFAGAMDVGIHTHSRFSGMEFPIDLRLLDALAVRVVSDLVVRITKGYYEFEGVPYWWNSDTIDLTDYLPATASTQAWIIIGFDTTATPHELIAMTGDEYPTALDLLESYIADVVTDFKAADYLPICAAKLTDSTTFLKEADFVALFSLGVGAGGGGGAFTGDAFDVPYTPTDPNVWLSPTIDNVGTALDEMAERRFKLDDSVEVTLDTSGVLDISAETSNHFRVDTFADAALDDVLTITGGVENKLYFFRAENTARTVRFSTVGNVYTNSGGTESLTSTEQMLIGIKIGTNWILFNTVAGGWNYQADSGPQITVVPGSLLEITAGAGISTTGAVTGAPNSQLTIALLTPVSLTNGGTGSNLSATGPGHIIQATNGAVLTTRLDNFTATVAPTVNEDSGDGYGIGSRWFDITADKEYVCLDATVGEAVWRETTGGGGSFDPDVAITFNDSGNDADYRFESNNDANNFFSDGGNDNAGFGTGTPDASAKVEIVATDKGFLLPRMTEAQRDAISSPADGLLAQTSDWMALDLYDSVRWRGASPIGHQARAMPAGTDVGGAHSATSVPMAANGVSWAMPIEITSHMLLRRVKIYSTATSLARTWGWDLYVDSLNNSNTLTRIAASNGNESFTASAAGFRALDVASAPVYLRPGTYWLVIQNRHATNTFIPGVNNLAVDWGSNYQEKLTTNPNGSTLDFVAATWTKPIARTVLAIMEGDVFGTGAIFD